MMKTKGIKMALIVILSITLADLIIDLIVKKIFNGYNGSFTTLNIANLAWNKVVGQASVNYLGLFILFLLIRRIEGQKLSLMIVLLVAVWAYNFFLLNFILSYLFHIITT